MVPRPYVRQAAEVRSAEIDYKVALDQVKGECRTEARDSKTQYSEMVSGVGVVSLDQLPDFNQNVNRSENTFYRACLSNEGTRDKMQRAWERWQNALQTIKETIDMNNQAIKDFLAETRQVQETKLRDCEDQKKLLAYQEALAAQTAAQATTMAKRKRLLGLVGTIGQCMSPTGGGRGLATDATGGMDTRISQ